MAKTAIFMQKQMNIFDSLIKKYQIEKFLTEFFKKGLTIIKGAYIIGCNTAFAMKKRLI